MSEDAGERWYQLIQAGDDLNLIIRALHDRAELLRKLAKSRKFSGPDAARSREVCRAEAEQCALIARRALAMTVPGGSPS
jgi:hypothetical protein